MVCFFSIFCALKRAPWLCKVTVSHAHLEAEKTGTAQPGIEGTVAKISSCILGLEGASFALRSCGLRFFTHRI